MTTLVWIDLETTGLSPAHDVILECAVIITNDQLVPRFEKSWVVAYEYDEIKKYTAFRMDPTVEKMHTDNGLLAECKMAKHDIYCVQREVAEAIQDHSDEGKPLLSGSSVHYDRNFIVAQMPLVDRLLHYRHFDVSVLHRCAEFWNPPLVPAYDEKDTKHRALDDIKHSLWVARHYRNIWLPAPETP